MVNNHSGTEVPANQVNDTPYEQQLKNAILKGFLSPVSSFIIKHMINHRTCRLQDFIEYARHAERHFQVKKKKQKKERRLL